MSDLREEFAAMKEHSQQRKETRREENLQYLQDNNIAWKWVDRWSDHILINGEIDYYLGKTYFFNRKTKKKGYLMLRNLLRQPALRKVPNSVNEQPGIQDIAKQVQEDLLWRQEGEKSVSPQTDRS